MRSRLIVVSFLGLAPIAQGCAPPKTVANMGTTPSFEPGLAVGEEWRQPPTFTVDLARPAYLTLFVVVPNHSAELLTVSAVEPDAMLAAGTHALRPAPQRTRAPLRSAGSIDGGTYPDLGAGCAVTDFAKETIQLSTGPDGKEQKADVITFATPTTSPPIVTCSVPGFGHFAPAPRIAPDRYLLVLATDKPVAREAIAGALERLDVAGTPREVSERVAALAAQGSHATEWGARAIRY